MRDTRQPDTLRIVGVEKSYPSGGTVLHVLGGVSLSLAAGEKVALMGESGSGKSTLLHLAAGLDRPDRGSVEIAGIDIGALSEAKRAAIRKDRIGIVFQSFNLIPSLTAGENLRFQARLAGREDRNWNESLERSLGLQDHLGKYPHQLSGGQQQRVAIGRALAHRPELILADEPTGNLDEASAGAVLDLLTGLTAESGAALLLVTHSREVAERLDRTEQLRQGQLL